MQAELRAIYLKSQIRELIHSSLVVVLFPAKRKGREARQVIDAKVITDQIQNTKYKI